MPKDKTISLLNSIIERINVGVLVIDSDMNIILWNGFMEMYSGAKADDVLNKNLFDYFPELPVAWMKKKIEGVFLFENYGFSSWKQRPYVFKFHHNRPLTGTVDHMRQDCVFQPVKNQDGKVEFVCITISDMTDNFIYESKLNDAMSSLKSLSRIDGLTGIFNRGHFERCLVEEWKRTKRYEEGLSFFLLDLDFFKKVNDTYGHLAGDEVLRRTVRIIVREIRETDIAGRYGGEEFAVILPHTDKQGAIAVAERIRKSVAEHIFKFEGQEIRLTLSIGVSFIRQNMKEYEQLISEADQAMYQSKEHGRNCITSFEQHADSQD
jgi:diguanylate cyclase